MYGISLLQENDKEESHYEPEEFTPAGGVVGKTSIFQRAARGSE